MLETKAKIKLLQPSHRAQKLCHSSGWSCPMWRPALFILITSSCRRTSTCCTLPAQPRLLDTAVLQAVGSKAMSPASGRLAAGYSPCLFWGIISGILLCTPGALCRGNTRHTTSGFVSLEASGQLSPLLLDFFILWKNVLSSNFFFFFFQLRRNCLNIWILIRLKRSGFWTPQLLPLCQHVYVVHVQQQTNLTSPPLAKTYLQIWMSIHLSLVNTLRPGERHWCNLNDAVKYSAVTSIQQHNSRLTAMPEGEPPYACSVLCYSSFPLLLLSPTIPIFNCLKRNHLQGRLIDYS